MNHVSEVFIPIIFFLVVGLAFFSYFYFRFRERQMLIEKGLDAQSIKEFFERKKDPTLMLKIGMVSVGFGLGLGFGMMLEDLTHKEYWIPFSLFVMTGLGFIVSHFVVRRLSRTA